MEGEGAASEADGCRFAARANADRSRSASEAWFAHNMHPHDGNVEIADVSDGVSKTGPKRVVRIRPEAMEIVAKNRRPAGSMGQMAGFEDDPKQMATSMTFARTRTSEAERNLHRMTKSSDNWNDFEANSKVVSEERGPRLGASEDAKEIMKSQTRKSDWFSHETSQSEPNPSKSSRPATAQTRSSTCDWFSHTEGGADPGDIRSLRRVKPEAEEYATRNHGHPDLLKTTQSGYATLPLSRSQTRNSKRMNQTKKAVDGVSQCLHTLDLKDDKVTPPPVKLSGEDALNWRNRGITSHVPFSTMRMHDQSETPTRHKKQRPVSSTERSQIWSCLSQLGNEVAPPMRLRNTRTVTEEARAAYERNRRGEMGNLIGSGADSTTVSYPGKTQGRAVTSDEARLNQAKARGSATRTLLTQHDNIPADRPQKRHNPAHTTPRDSISEVFSCYGASVDNRPIRRLVSAEARTNADRQGGVRDLLSYA